MCGNVNANVKSIMLTKKARKYGMTSWQNDVSVVQLKCFSKYENFVTEKNHTQ